MSRCLSFADLVGRQSPSPNDEPPSRRSPRNDFLTRIRRLCVRDHLLRRAARLSVPRDFRRIVVAILRRDPSTASSSSTLPRHGCHGPCFQRKLPSLSRQRHPTVAHRFNGGKAVPTNPPSPARDGRCLRKPWWCDRGIAATRCEFLSPLSGLRSTSDSWSHR